MSTLGIAGDASIYYLFGIFLLTSVVIIGLRAVFRQLHRLRIKIQELELSLTTSPPIKKEIIRDSDNLPHTIDNMRSQIDQMLKQAEVEERNKQLLEAEKLIHQINPHFIHNTINTVQWLAMINGQDEIVHLLAIFSRLMHYNLGKEGGIVTIREEINALKDYVALQQIRYAHKFSVDFDIDEDTQEIGIPRFLLQPLVENAMYHGFSHSDGIIKVIIKRFSASHLLLIVEDNGAGMSEEEVTKLFKYDQSKQKVGLGIGLSFVNKIVKATYGENCSLRVESRLGQGTEIKLKLPLIYKEEWENERAYRG